MKPRNLISLLSSTILLLMTGSLALAMNTSDQIPRTKGYDNDTFNQIAYRSTSKVSGETITLYPSQELHLSVDAPPEENSTIIIAGGDLYFENTSLEEVAALINRVYNTNLVIRNRELASCPITVTFRDQTLESVLNVLEMTLDLEISRSGNSIVLDGKGCIE